MKELEEIYQEMLDCFAQRTGLEAAESCDLAVRFYCLLYTSDAADEL